MQTLDTGGAWQCCRRRSSQAARSSTGDSYMLPNTSPVRLLFLDIGEPQQEGVPSCLFGTALSAAALAFTPPVSYLGPRLLTFNRSQPLSVESVQEQIQDMCFLRTACLPTPPTMFAPMSGYGNMAIHRYRAQGSNKCNHSEPYVW